MGELLSLWIYFVPFLVILTVLVFVHEMGHYLVARWNGVRVEVFSIGFGKTLFGWTDKAGTSWKIAAIPLGGYVKFFGDANPASTPDGEALSELTDEERQVSFHHKRLRQRVAIVAAGPIANFIYAIVVLAIVYVAFGQRTTPPEIGRVLPNSVGSAVNLQRGDVILEVDGDQVYRFEQVQQAVLLNPNRELQFKILRDGQAIDIAVTPAPFKTADIDGIEREFGDLGIVASNPARVGAVRAGSPAAVAGFQPDDVIVQIDGTGIDTFEQLQDIVGASAGRELAVDVDRQGRVVALRVAAAKNQRTLDDGSVVDYWLIGIERAQRPLVRHGPGTAVIEALRTSVDMIDGTLKYVGQMIIGRRGTEDLGGPLRIAQVSGEAAKLGIEQLIQLSVLLSLNLGLINLFPIPLLDGGHLMLYAYEAVRGRPLTDRMQEYAFRFGLAVILTLTVFVTWNDLVNLRVVEFLADLFS